MTIMNGFVKAAEEVCDHTSSYFISRDPQELEKAIEVLEAQIEAYREEQAQPALQETRVTLTRMTAEVLVKTIERDNSVVLNNGDYLADGRIEAGKFIRVFTSDQEENSAYLTKVTLASDDILVLAPVVVGP